LLAERRGRRGDVNLYALRADAMGDGAWSMGHVLIGALIA
jgi:hypothetical protein